MSTPAIKQPSPSSCPYPIQLHDADQYKKNLWQKLGPPSMAEDMMISMAAGVFVASVKMAGFTLESAILTVSPFTGLAVYVALKYFFSDKPSLFASFFQKEPVSTVHKQETFPPKVVVEDSDTISCARRLHESLPEGNKKVLVLDMANSYGPGGAQEGDLCDNSDLAKRLNQSDGKGGRRFYPNGRLPIGGSLVENVQFKPSVKGKGFTCDVYALAAYDCRKGGDAPASHDMYISGTKHKIRCFLRAALKNEIQAVVSSALGCGNFKNNPEVVARCFKEVLAELEFCNAPFSVHFAIPNAKGRNFQIFQRMLGTGCQPAIPVLSAAENVAIYRETCAEASKRGFPKPAVCRLHLNQPVPLSAHISTHITVENKTALRVTQELVEQKYRPLVLDLANRYTEGGGVKRGANAQEEILCRQSNLMEGLEVAKKEKRYPLPDLSGLLVKGVTFFRADPQQKYRYLEKPFQADVYALAAYQCIPGHSDRPREDSVYRENTKEKIREYCRAGVRNGNDALVPGALGCGAFQNDPSLVAQLFYEVLHEPEFAGKFKRIAFAIVDDHNGRNFLPFQKQFSTKK